MKTTFFIPGIPVSKGRPRFGKGHAYTPEKTRVAEESFLWQAMKHKPKKPITGAIRLSLSFDMPIPESTSKKKREKMIAEWTPHVKKPDKSNLEKLVEDALNGTFWKDDSQIAVSITMKQYAEKPGTWVTVEEIS